MQNNNINILLPSPTEAKEYISALESENWIEYDGSNLDVYLKNMHQKISKICGSYQAFYVQFSKDLIPELKFYRVRELRDISRPDLRSSYSYPPYEKVNENRRANLIGHPVFYGCEDPIVALYELINDVKNVDQYLNKTYVVSTWILKQNNNFFLSPFIPQSLREINGLCKLSDYNYKDLESIFKRPLNSNEIEGLKILFDYFANLYIRDDKRSISAYIAHFHIHYNPFITSIFAYPSIKVNNINNFAMHPNFVDENLLLSHLYHLKITSEIKEVPTHDKFKCKIEFGPQFAETSNNKIIFHEIYKKKTLFEELLKIDFKRYQANI